MLSNNPIFELGSRYHLIKISCVISCACAIFRQYTFFKKLSRIPSMFIKIENLKSLTSLLKCISYFQTVYYDIYTVNRQGTVQGLQP